MFCSFCGKEIRDGATFCGECGKNQITGNMKPGVKPNKTGIAKKKVVSFISVAMVIVLIIFCVKVFGPKSVTGVWMSGTDKVTFTSDGDFKIDSTYGTYTIDDNRNLIMVSGEYSYWSGRWEYKYGSEAKEDKKYWYRSGDKLYFQGREYTKQ